MQDGQLLTIDRTALNSTRVVLALLAGFIASVAMVLAFGVAFVAALVLSRVPVPILSDWFRGLTRNQLIDLLDEFARNFAFRRYRIYQAIERFFLRRWCRS